MMMMMIYRKSRDWGDRGALLPPPASAAPHDVFPGFPGGASGKELAHQAPLSVRSPRQEYWSGLPFPSTWDLPNPGIEPASLEAPAL